MIGQDAPRAGDSPTATPFRRATGAMVRFALAAIAISLLSNSLRAADNVAAQEREAASASTTNAGHTLRASYGKPQTILTDEGPISFGMILSVEVVSWSAPDAKDLLISRCWDGIYLYPSRDLQEFGAPIRLCDTLRRGIIMVRTSGAFPDQPSMIVCTDRKGNLFQLEKVGQYPKLRLKMVGPIRNAADGLPFNIPLRNPNYQVDSGAGWIDLNYYNYLFPSFYPAADDKRPGLLVGDWAGWLWWMPPAGEVKGLPAFAGKRYQKPTPDSKHRWIVRDRYLRSAGRDFVEPLFRASDDQGQPFLLGFAVEKGQRFDGGAARPVYYKGDRTGSDDLLVWGGMFPNELVYLKQASGADDSAPRFTSLGPVKLTGYDAEEFDQYAYHSSIAVFHRDGWNHLLISRGSNLAVFENDRLDSDRPAFQLSHWIRGKDVPLRGFNYTEILTTETGKRYILDNDNHWWFQELRSSGEKTRVAAEAFPLLDQNGQFEADAETDPNHGVHWGSHHAALWDYDGSGKQHLIVGSDGGRLYLLRHDKPLGVNNRFEFTSSGPLKNSAGKEIKVHNRVVAAPIDLNGDGRLDLVLGGTTFQLGINTDPTPGGGLYYAINGGVDNQGLPILEPLRPLETIGHRHDAGLNDNYQIQALDLMGGPDREVVIATKGYNMQGHVYRLENDRIALEFTGTVLPMLNVEDRLLDLDNDGRCEYVRGGSETLIGTYSEVVIE
ncbi:MAG: hypothetical protein WD468_12800 [Pirellulales bacterium]